MSTLPTEPKVTPTAPQDDPTSLLPKKLARSRPLFDPEIVNRAIRASFGKLNPVTLLKNPVMFVVEVGAALTTVFLIRDLAIGAAGIGFTLQISLWLWFTVLFANFAEAMAEGRGKAPADTLRKSRVETKARRLRDPADRGDFVEVAGTELRMGDVILCLPGDVIASDGEVVDGVASVDESAITGESA